jgi:hypothetical protein
MSWEPAKGAMPDLLMSSEGQVPIYKTKYPAEGISQVVRESSHTAGPQ